MPDVDERLVRVEQGLTGLSERMDQRFSQVEERFAQIDQRFAQVDQRFDTLEVQVQKLRVLEEENATQIKRIAEVQTHHGSALDEHGAALKRIEEAIVPLKVLPAAIHRLFHDLGDHGRRITALEQARRESTPNA